MAFDRAIWQAASFTKDYVPPWPCPRCLAGTLSVSKDTLKSLRTSAATEAMKREGFDPEIDHHRFVALFFCSRENCREPVAVCGSMSFAEDYDDEDGRPLMIESYEPEYFTPSPPILTFSKNVPPPVRTLIEASFSLLWCDRESCANRIRSGIEAIMDDLGVKRTTINAAGKRQWLALHARIQMSPLSPGLRETCLALKWLGNEGTHARGKLTREDVLDGYDLVAHLIEEVYDERSKVLAKLSKQIIQRKGRSKRA